MDHFAALLAVVYIGAQSPYTIPVGSELTCRFGHASAGADVQFVAVWWLPIPCVAVPRAVLYPGDASELNGYQAETRQGDRGGLPAAAGCGQEVSIDFVVTNLSLTTNLSAESSGRAGIEAVGTNGTNT